MECTHTQYRPNGEQCKIFWVFVIKYIYIYVCMHVFAHVSMFACLCVHVASYVYSPLKLCMVFFMEADP
jgi:hypothetical protein